jgi:hypothetical protein
MKSLRFLLVALAACGDTTSAQPDASTDASTDAPLDAPAFDAPTDSAPSCAANVDVASLSAHNTSAFAQYDQAHFPANFGATTWVSQSGATIPIDPTKVDLSVNPVTPGHVSNVSVHTLLPSRPALRWFAHITPWFRAGGGGGHIDIGLQYDSDAYVQSMVDDMRRRGFDGVIVDWYGQGSYSDSVTLRMQKYIATLGTHAFTFVIMMDKGISGLSSSVLQQQVQYVQTQYFVDPNYELEGAQPILMFFGVDAALGSATMASVKAATGGKMVWVVQGTGSLGDAWVDEVFDWTHDYKSGPSTTDPYNLAGVKSFYAAMSGSTKKAFGSMVAGFDGTLTKTVSWSKGKYLPRDSGACVVQWAKTIDAAIPSNVTRMQWATWSDWEEGTEIEAAVENDASVTASLAGSTLSWTVKTGTGDESTIDHYEVYASADGVKATDLGSVPAGTHQLDLSTACDLAKGPVHVFVDAVGKATIRDHLSAPVDYTKP